MKKLILILFLAIGITTQSQIEFGIYQDIKLASMEDDYGNSPYTVDLLTSMRWFNGGSGHECLNPTFVQLTYEYADLSGGSYNRWAMGLGYSFNNFDEYNWRILDKVMKRMSITLATDFGSTTRWGGTAFSMAGFLDISFEILEDLDIVMLGHVVTRPHLKERWGETKPTYSVYGGLKYKI